MNILELHLGRLDNGRYVLINPLTGQLAAGGKTFRTQWGAIRRAHRIQRRFIRSFSKIDNRKGRM